MLGQCCPAHEQAQAHLIHAQRSCSTHPWMQDRRAPSDSPWDLPVWVRAVLRTEENWAEIEARAKLEDGDPDLVAEWYAVSTLCLLFALLILATSKGHAVALRLSEVPVCWLRARRMRGRCMLTLTLWLRSLQ